MELFFTNTPVDTGMAFVLVPHLSPEHKSMMVELLKRYTAMDIFQAEDGMRVNPNCVYVIPPDRDMSIRKRRLQLLEPAERRGLRHPIDFFFRSLAEDQGERAISVVLSGTGSEGALGVRAIKEKGGLVLVQDPNTTRYDGMPNSAIATGIVDYILPPDKMPERMLGHLSHGGAHLLESAPIGESGDADPLQNIFNLIQTRTKHDFSLYKPKTVLHRIGNRMAILHVGSMEVYAAYLRKNPKEIELLFSELLIRVTNFFRDRDAFEILKEKVLPPLFKDRPPGEPVRIWVPACSTGEEAYSLAILVQEYMSTLKNKYTVQIFATDIDKDAIDKARTGLYPNGISVDVSPGRRNRFFTKKESGWKINEEIRQMIVFALQDLIKDPPFTKLDMVSCRNALIYFDAKLQEKVLPVFHYALKTGGILFLGSSETIGNHAGMFSHVDRKWRIFRTKGPETSPAPSFPSRNLALPAREPRTETSPAVKRSEEVSMGALGEKIILAHYAPPFVIINEKRDILFFSGRTGRYLEPATGKAALNINEMVRDELRFELKTVLRKAVAHGEDITSDVLKIKTTSGIRAVLLEIRHIAWQGSIQGLLMVVFREIPLPMEQKKPGKRSTPSRNIDRHVFELEHELKSTKDQLQATIEELETSNQDLGSTNEELQSSNEELQSTIEEMETSREELQSVNEELTTINTELQIKADESAELTNDMNNLIASTQIATIFLDEDLRIKRFTPAAVNVVNLVETDTGRPFSDLSLKVEYPEMREDIQESRRALALKERIVGLPDGRWFKARILPYRTTNNIIDGVVITFIDVTEQKNTQEALENALAYAEGIVETAREPLVVIDSEFRVITANTSFYRNLRSFKRNGREEVIF